MVLIINVFNLFGILTIVGLRIVICKTIKAHLTIKSATILFHLGKYDLKFYCNL